MKFVSLRTSLALGALCSLVSLASAAEHGFANMTNRWWQQANSAGVNQAEFSAEATDGGEELMPAGYGSYQTCSYDGCSCDSCGVDGGYACEGCPCDGYACEGPCQSNYCGACDSCGVGMCYAEIQNMFLRAHVSSDVVGKLKEKYEWSPRAVIGYESPSGLGARGRYWNYTRTTNTVDNDDSLRFEMDVYDIEGTARFSTKRADIVISGGFRFADIEITEDDDDAVGADMPGITFAIDGRIPICCGHNNEWAGVCGARWSLLGGDWDGDSNNVIEPTFDDNVTVNEIYGGFEWVCHKRNCDLYARFVFEIQNWHSDALGESSATDSISFIGPAIHGGIVY